MGRKSLIAFAGGAVTLCLGVGTYVSWRTYAGSRPPTLAESNPRGAQDDSGQAPPPFSRNPAWPGVPNPEGGDGGSTTTNKGNPESDRPASNGSYDAFLADHFGQQRPDPRYSATMRYELSGLVQRLNLEGTTIDEITCAATFCRLTLTYDNSAAMTAFRTAAMFGGDQLFRGGGTATKISQDGDRLTYLLYLARPGFSLPKLPFAGRHSQSAL